MLRMIVAIDVDGTLINEDEDWNLEVIAVAKAAHDNGHSLRVWSGGGSDYAQLWADRLEKDFGIPADAGGKVAYFAYDNYPHVAIDDADTPLWEKKDVKLIWVDTVGTIPNMVRALELVEKEKK